MHLSSGQMTSLTLEEQRSKHPGVVEICSANFLCDSLTWEHTVLTWAAFISGFLRNLATSPKAGNLSSFSVGGALSAFWADRSFFSAWDSQNCSMLGNTGFLALNASSLHKSLRQSEMSPHVSRCLWLLVDLFTEQPGKTGNILFRSFYCFSSFLSFFFLFLFVFFHCGMRNERGIFI